MRTVQAGVWAIMTMAMVVGCTPANTGKRYDSSQVGRELNVTFATVLAVREVEISEDASTTGALAGGLAGGVAGANVGRGTGKAAGAVGGALIGAAIGSLAEQALKHRHGFEYVLMKQNGKAMTIVQEREPEEEPLAVGSRVMLQEGYDYTRVLPADHLPEEVTRPKAIRLKQDEPAPEAEPPATQSTQKAVKTRDDAAEQVTEPTEAPVDVTPLSDDAGDPTEITQEPVEIELIKDTR